MNLFFNEAHAQAAQTAAEQPNMLMSFAPLIIVFLIFYFLMIKPQQKKFKQEQEYISKLQKGDEVYTKSGILGVISGITEKIVTLEVEGGVKIKFLKSQIAGSSKDLLVEQK
jgi:preprotein translocase subunit YajC